MGNNEDIYCYAKSGGGNFRKRMLSSTPWYQNPCVASIFLHARPNLRKKLEKLKFQSKILPFYGPPLPIYNEILKHFTYNQMFYIMDWE